MTKKRLKRIICLLASFSVCFSIIFSNFSILSCAADNSDEISREDFYKKLSFMIALGEGYSSSYETESEENGEIVVKTETSTNRLIVSTDFNTEFSNNYGAIAKSEGYNNWHIFQYATLEEATIALNAFSNDSKVNYVEFDKIIESVDTKIEPISGNETESLSWGSERVKSKTAKEALKSSKIEFDELVVAVIDSGIDVNHEFFKYKTSESRIISGNDGNDHVDSYNHGTHVAGIIVDNTLSNVKIKPYNYIFQGFTTTVTMATMIKSAVDDGADIINLSMGEDENQDISEIESKAVAEEIYGAINKNIPVVIAAGNEGEVISELSMASHPEAITVAAICIDDLPTIGSNYGECVDIAAPGKDIYSTVRNYAGDNNRYGYNTGTSMATPFVTAAVAMIKSLHPNLTPAQIKEKLISCVDVPKGWDSRYGAGVVDFEKIIENDRLAPPSIILSKDGATIKHSVPGVKIYYTTDGTNPVIGESQIYNSEIIRISGISYIKAVAYKEKKLPSCMITKSMKFSMGVNVRYKGVSELPYVPDSPIIKCYSSNEDVATISYSGKITGISVGKAKITVFFENNQVGVYNVNVEYTWWQWLIHILLWGFLWY